MNCPNCNGLLDPNGTCPNCGYPNTKVDTPQDDQFIELEDEEVQQITEDMAPPTLNVESEDLAAEAGDLNAANVSTYSPEEAKIEAEEAIKEQTLKQEQIDIAIPAVQAPVDKVNIPTDGTAPEMQQDNQTIGSKSEDIISTATGSDLSIPTKKKGFKISIPKGASNVPKNFMIIVAVICLVIGILVGKMFFSKNYCASNSGGTFFAEKVKFVNDGKNNVTNVNGVTYKIPSQYTYDKKDNGLLIYNDKDEFRIFMRGTKGVFNDLLGSKTSMKQSMIEAGITVNNVKEVKAGDINFLVFETVVNSHSSMICFTEGKNGSLFYIEIVTSDNNYKYDLLEVIADIIKNSKGETVVTNMEKVNVTDIGELTIKAAQVQSSNK